MTAYQRLYAYKRRLNEWSGSRISVHYHPEGYRLTGKDGYGRRVQIVGTATFCLAMLRKIRADSQPRSFVRWTGVTA